jgi:hypothetical protein
VWADRESEIDYLNFSEISEQAVDVITSPGMLPISLGVFGNWGAGKSTLLKLIEKDLNTSEEPSSKTKKKYILVNFDAWLYQGYDDSRAALLEVISTELNKATEDNKPLHKKTKNLLARINIFRVLGLGTSQSHPGSGGSSPLVPPWADDKPQQTLSSPLPARFKPFRQAFGSFVSSGDDSKLKSALGNYARKGTGGANSAVRRFGATTQAGGALHGFLTGGNVTSNGNTINLGSLSGIPCEIAINRISQLFTSNEGDSDKISSAMGDALTEALDGIATFDPDAITDDVIIDVMICYLSESIFLQIVQDAGKAWNKAETPSQMIAAENDLREMIKVTVDGHFADKLKGNVSSFTTTEMTQIQRDVIGSVWSDWEEYQ